MSALHLSKEHVQEIGALLKSSRERQGENLAEVAFRIALSPSQLRAIEAGDLRPFYSAGYFLQAAERYASFLNIKLPQLTTKNSDQQVVVHADNAQESIQKTRSHEIAPEQKPGTDSPGSDNAPHVDDQPGHSATPRMGARSWGWLAFGAAVLITVGIVKISSDKPATPDAAVSAAPTSTTATATVNESVTTAPAVTAAPTTSTASTVVSSTAPLAPTASPSMPQDRLTNPSAKPVNALDPGPNDSQLESQAQTWVQLVKTSGEKINLKIESGQKIEFVAETAAAIVFGQPEKVVLTVKGKAVNLKPFIAAENPSRALVILSQIRD